jgi:hypothetical protein
MLFVTIYIRKNVTGRIMKIKDRIKEFKRVPASQLMPNPKNWRTHPEAQKDGLKTVLAEIGFADAVIARETPEGYQLLDGHLRTETVGDGDVPTLIVDLNDEEADIVLTTLDPLASLAETDVAALSDLMRNIDIENDQLSILLEDISDSYSLEFHELNEQSTDADYADFDFEEGANIQNPNLVGTKAVVLHFNEDEYDTFYEKAFELGDKWDIDNLASVILRTVTEAYAKEIGG